MNAQTSDVHQTLEYRADTFVMKGVPFALMLCLLGLVVLALDDRPPAKVVAMVVVVVGAGIGWIGFALWRRFNSGKPLFVLSPKGIHYRLAKEVLIPWREIQGVDTIDITTFVWWSRYPQNVTFHDVTVVLVPKRFYDSHIFMGFFRRGPGWGIKFIPKGSSVQVALHHELVSVEPRALREAVEARWRAFRGQPVEPRSRHVPVVRLGRSEAAAHPGPTPGNVASGSKPMTWSAWQVAKIVVPLIGIAVVLANLLGLWATPGQTAVREERKQEAERERQREEQQRRIEETLEEGRRSIEKSWEEFRRHQRF